MSVVELGRSEDRGDEGRYVPLDMEGGMPESRLGRRAFRLVKELTDCSEIRLLKPQVRQRGDRKRRRVLATGRC